MATMRMSTPDALDDRAEEAECQTTVEPEHSGGVSAVPFSGKTQGKPFIKKKTVAWVAIPPVAERTNGLKEACSTSLTLCS